MDTIDTLDRPAAEALFDQLELDEAFLASIDRAMHESKVRDPYRLDQINRAANEELRMNPFGALP